MDILSAGCGVDILSALSRGILPRDRRLEACATHAARMATPRATKGKQMKTRSIALALAALGILVFAACSHSRQPGRDRLEDVTVGSGDNAGGQFVSPDSRGGTGNDAGFFFQDQPPTGNVRIDQREPDNGQPAPKRVDGHTYDEFWEKYETNPFIDTEDLKLSTFAVDVDTGAYTKTRDYLNRGELPPKGFARVEEFVNYFDYKYEGPSQGAFHIDVAAAPSRYGTDIKNAHLLRIGMQAQRIDAAQRKPAVLTFVIDVSGSMDYDNRLGLVKRALHMLIDQLNEGDSIGIAIYGSRGQKFMDHTSDHSAIRKGIDSLHTEGSTNAGEGIEIGYKMAAEAFRDGHINRVVLCSDGVANTGVVDQKGILKNVEEHRRKGIQLSCIGFGMGNYNDTFMEQLGNKGDGHYAYVDGIDEARRVFVDNLTGTLQVVARDTKVQVEFNPKVVKSWRLIGYENRWLKSEDFRDDSVDGGEVGAGHSVTALYEVKLFDDAHGAICEATIRYKHDERHEFHEVAREINVHEIQAWDATPASFRLAANVAEFGELIRASYWSKGGSYDAVLDDVRKLIAETDDKNVLEFATLITKARDLSAAEAKATAGGE